MFAGSEDNLLDRYYQAAVNHAADVVVRLPADNATPEPEEIDRIVEFHFNLSGGASVQISPTSGVRGILTASELRFLIRPY